MPTFQLNDETIWGLAGAKIAPPLPGVEAFVTTPILELLRAGAAYDPDAVALVSLTASLQFGEMLRLAQNAAYAVARLVPPGGAVACLLPRTPDAIVALLGCLISGRICLGLDPANPPDRQLVLLEDAAPAALMVAEPPAFAFAGPVLMAREAVAGPDAQWHPDHASDPDAPCAVYFTSGSSGRPKGIVLSLRSVLYRALDAAECWGLTYRDRIIAPSIPVTSSGLAMLLGALSRGARVLLSSVAGEGAGAVLRLMEREMPTCGAFVPPVMRLLNQLERAKSAFRSMRSLRFGAAALPRLDVMAWRQKLPADCLIWHTYASTEALIVASWAVPADDPDDAVTVAAGLMQTTHEYALLGDDDRPVSPGTPGELVLRSHYLALGEWQQGKLVSGRMIPVPDRSGWRFFRTGDVLRVEPNGHLRVLGRADRQVKINATRVEPGEIEAVLRAEPAVIDAAVVAKQVAGGVALHGFVAATADDPAALIVALRQRLAAALPASLRPSGLTVLDRLPTLPNGKIDLVALTRKANQ